MATIRIDRSVCQGYGNCVLADPASFDIDDDGLVVLIRESVEGKDLAAAKQAAYDCPSEAILVEESPA